jgi:hypothetical protein
LATTVGTVEVVELQDDTEVVLRPLVIAKLEKFMEMMAEMAYADDDKATQRIMFNCAAFCLSKQRPDFWDQNKSNGSYPNPDASSEDGDNTPKTIKFMKGGYTEDFAEAVDLPTVTKIIEVCGGINFNDPNLLRAAAEAQAANGTTD